MPGIYWILKVVMARMSEQDIKQECQNDIIQHAIYKITKNKAHINHYSLSLIGRQVTIGHFLSFSCPSVF